jgi:hypothetical protein
MTGINPIGAGSGGSFDADPRFRKRHERPPTPDDTERRVRKTIDEIAEQVRRQGPPEEGLGENLDVTVE